jgi:3-oxoadipate enol-lactonase
MDRARVNGVELAYEVSGGGGEAMVLLNGIGMSIGHWRPAAALLAGSRQVLLHDFRGQLLSERPAGPYSLELHARDLAALLDHLGMGRVHVVGTSYGSEVGLVFARLFPERCLSLCVVDGTSEVGPLLKAAVVAWRSAALADPSAFYRALVPWTYSERWIRENEAAIDAREKAVAGLPRDYFTAFAALCDAFLEMDETPHLAEITAPSLVLVGSEDILKHPGYSRIIADGIEDASLRILPGLGHGAVIEDPRAVARAVMDFLDGLAARRKA